ncbi:phospholipase D family protein [Sandaracinobacteroides hominis]|uniref:phospholipase D family protein n=1 Tax=Sandaracinobacteroides hominis TaxID=2780086 RepID=UPI0018F307AE|nr:phospholipase D family protein [Sandaracinobacteroides hominis]
MTGIFLPPERGPRRDSPPEDKPFPPRTGIRVTPLILAAEMYPELERLVLGAETSIYMAFRIFDPATRTRSPEAKEAGLPDWASLLKSRVKAGVQVRILLTDFEPTVAHALHASSWSSFRALKDLLEDMAEPQRELFEIIVSQHEGEVGWAVRQALRLPMGFLLRKIVREFAETGGDIEELLAVRPGLWRYVKSDGGTPRFRRGPPPRLWPATHHHKFAVIDGKVAIVGGLDVDERRWETRRYAQPAPETWHDVSVKLEGPAAGDAQEHFRRLWNFELPRFREITSHWLIGQDRKLVIDPLDEIADATPLPPAIPGSTATGQLLRTRSRRSRKPFALGPARHIRELMAAHRQLIFSARRLLYIEAQFFRSRRAAGWIVEAARRNPGLQVIIVLPQAPDEVAFEGHGNNPAHRHGEWLQARALGKLRRKLGPRVGLFALGRKSPLTEEEKQLVADRGAVFGAGMIYVHSKLLIADDEHALVSSANINGRSFGWDSEFGLLW